MSKHSKQKRLNRNNEYTLAFFKIYLIVQKAKSEIENGDYIEYSLDELVSLIKNE